MGWEVTDVRGRIRRGNPLGGGFPHMTPERSSKRRMCEAVADRAWHAARLAFSRLSLEESGLVTARREGRAESRRRLPCSRQQPVSRQSIVRASWGASLSGIILTRPQPPRLFRGAMQVHGGQALVLQAHSTSNLGHRQRHRSTTGPLQWYTAGMTERTRGRSYPAPASAESW